MTLNIGDRAPDFTLLDGAGNTVRLADLAGQRVVLYFYPRDNTPGCSKEACAFRDLHGEFLAAGAVVLGVSTDEAKSHQKFSQKFSLPFPLLCDPGGQVAAAYDSYGRKKFMGKEFDGVFRHTVVISPEGTIEHLYKKVKPEVHAAQVLADLGNSTAHPAN